MFTVPKWMLYNRREPIHHPFEGGASGNPDFDRPTPEFFQHLETQVAALRDLGVQADVIRFHPYDTWGYADMGRGANDRYLEYVIARLAPYRNVWWSLANEWDRFEEKTESEPLLPGRPGGGPLRPPPLDAPPLGVVRVRQAVGHPL